MSTPWEKKLFNKHILVSFCLSLLDRDVETGQRLDVKQVTKYSVQNLLKRRLQMAAEAGRDRIVNCLYYRILKAYSLAHHLEGPAQVP